MLVTVAHIENNDSKSSSHKNLHKKLHQHEMHHIWHHNNDRCKCPSALYAY